MNCVMFGADNTAPSTSANQYAFLTACFSTSWNSTENTRTIPISEAITITAINVYLDTAPGTAASGKSYTFTIRDNGAGTSAAVTITDAAVTGSFSGSVSIAKDHLVALEAAPANTPTASTNIYWQIYYTTATSSFLMMGSNNNNASNSATNYSDLIGGIGTAFSATDGDFDIICPSAGTLTALSVASPAGVPGGTSYALSVHRNNTTDDLTATITAAITAAQATGSVAWTAGDTLSLKCVPAGTPTARRLGWCVSVTPTTDGEMFSGFGSAAVPSASATNFEQLQGNGNNGWNSSESVRLMKPPAVDYKKLYIKTTNPSPGNRTITFMDNTVATALTANIASGSTTANDTTHTVTFSATGNTGTWRSTIAASPAASTGFHIGFVMYIAQTPPPASSITFITYRPPWRS